MLTLKRWLALLFCLSMSLNSYGVDTEDDELLNIVAALAAIGGTYAAEFHSQNVPTGMSYGSWYQVSVQYKNTGARAWIPGVVRLVNATGYDFGVSEVPLTYEVGTGGVATFSFSIKKECGTYLPFPFFSCADSQPKFSWIMAGESGSFGSASPVLSDLYGRDDPQIPDGGGGELPPQPSTPMVDLFIPLAPPPTTAPPSYRPPQYWGDISW